MTCKECLFYKRCRWVAEGLRAYGKTVEFDDDIIPADKACSFFKNKADVVEVVRCKDCKHNKYEQPNGFIHCHRDRKEGWIFRRKTDFCSYGEKEQGVMP